MAAEDAAPDDGADAAASQYLLEGPQVYIQCEPPDKVSAKASELSGWVLASLRRGESPALLPDFVSRASDLEDWEFKQFQLQLKLGSDIPDLKTEKPQALWEAAEAGASLPPGSYVRKPPPLPQKKEDASVQEVFEALNGQAEALQRLRTNLAELDAMMARLTHHEPVATSPSASGDAAQLQAPRCPSRPPMVQRHLSAGSVVVRAPQVPQASQAPQAPQAVQAPIARAHMSVTLPCSNAVSRVPVQIRPNTIVGSPLLVSGPRRAAGLQPKSAEDTAGHPLDDFMKARSGSFVAVPRAGGGVAVIAPEPRPGQRAVSSHRRCYVMPNQTGVSHGYPVAPQTPANPEPLCVQLGTQRTRSVDPLGRRGGQPARMAAQPIPAGPPSARLSTAGLTSRLPSAPALPQRCILPVTLVARTQPSTAQSGAGSEQPTRS